MTGRSVLGSDSRAISRSTVSERSRFEGKAHVLRAMGDADLILDSLLVRVDGLRRDPQLLPDLRSVVSPSGEYEHALLALAQALHARPGILLPWCPFAFGTGKLLRHRRADVDIARCDNTYRIAEFALYRSLGEKSSRARGKEGQQLLLFRVHCDDQYTNARKLPLQRSRRREAVAIRHVQIHQHDVRTKTRRHFQRLLPIQRLSHDTNLGERAKYELDTGAHEVVIVDEQNTNQLGPVRHSACSIRPRRELTPNFRKRTAQHLQPFDSAIAVHRHVVLRRLCECWRIVHRLFV